jgi:hypothetical protein
MVGLPKVAFIQAKIREVEESPGEVDRVVVLRVDFKGVLSSGQLVSI